MKFTLHRLPRTLTLLGALVFSCALAFAEPGFCDSLTAADKTSCGLSKLSQPQIDVLSTLIQRDLDLARQGGVTGFSTTFTQRRRDKERENSGISLMTDAERARLDALIASAMVNNPAPIPTYMRSSSTAQKVEVGKIPPNVHGSMTLMMGTSGKGRNFYGGAMETNYTDPSGRMTIGVGYSQLRGRGWMNPYDPYYYGYGPGYYGPLY